MNKRFTVLTTSAIIAVGMVAMPATAQLLAPQVGTLSGVVTPGIVGDTVQVGVGRTRVGSTDGLVGAQGRPTTKVGVNILTQNNPPEGSAATVSVPPSAVPSLHN